MRAQARKVFYRGLLGAVAQGHGLIYADQDWAQAHPTH
jgi:hypothetical protein